MDALEMTLLFDYYGDLLTDRQRLCIDMRYNQDLSLGEIAQELGVSRQGVFDTITRAEALLRNMEEKTGCVERDLRCRRAVTQIRSAAQALSVHSDPRVAETAKRILETAAHIEE
ncbi:MAG: YlxM family DNA-binding protein [Faecousia sp.]